ncbi:MAG: hypothetical protein HY000_32330 [Planctomycetes bacterium]|nr:hypothetical protein [Planctomycetota bacterium]
MPVSEDEGISSPLIAAVLEAFPNVNGILVDRQESINRAAPRFESKIAAN